MSVSLFLILIPMLAVSCEILEPDSGCYIGVYLGINVEGQEIGTPIDSFLSYAYKPHAIYHRYVAYGTPFPTVWAESVATYCGAVPLISYGLPDSNQLDTLITLNDQNFTTFVNELVIFDHPAFFRFGAEMNGPWSPWGQIAAKYVPAFKRAAEYIHSCSNKIAMVWCPNFGGGYPWGGRDEGDAYTVYYPCDDGQNQYGSYVDWVGLDFFRNEFWGTEHTPLDVFLGKTESSAIDFYKYFCDSLRKPLMIAETASLEAVWDASGPDSIPLEGNNREGRVQRPWLEELYNICTLKNQYPKIKAIFWFHVKKKETMWVDGVPYNIWFDWRITTRAESDTPQFSYYVQLTSDPYFLSSVTDVKETNSSTVEQGFHLLQNVPNPAISETAISYMLPQFCYAVMKVYNLAGGNAVTLIDGWQEGGFHTICWNGKDASGQRLADGVYFYRLQVGNRRKTGKMVLLSR